MTTMVQGLQPLATTPGLDKDAARQAKLVDAAHQFEGMLLEEMLKGMQTGKNEMTGEGDEGDNSGDTLRTYGTEAMAKAISQHGGIGIARQVIATVTSESHRGAAKTS